MTQIPNFPIRAHHRVYPTSNSFEAQIAPKVQNKVVLMNDASNKVLRLNLNNVLCPESLTPDLEIIF